MPIEQPTNEPEAAGRNRGRILIDIGMTCTVCGNPTRNEGEECNRCVRAMAKINPPPTIPAP